MTDTTERTIATEQVAADETASLLPTEPAYASEPEEAELEPYNAPEGEGADAPVEDDAPEGEEDTAEDDDASAGEADAAEAGPALPPLAEAAAPAPPQTRALRAELAEPAPAEEGAEGEDFKRRYWRSVLTGNPATIPAAVRKKAGVDELEASAEQKEYRLLSTINRSWAADHLPQSREKVRADWPQQRARIARRLRVRNNEQEVFLALSQEAEDEPRREAASRINRECYLAGLEGRQPELTEEMLKGLSAEDAQNARSLAKATYERGKSRRGELIGLAERIVSGVDAFSSVEDTAFPAPRTIAALPALLQAVDELAEQDEDSRNTALYLAAGMARQEQGNAEAPGVVGRLVQAMRRGAAGLGQGMLQGVSHAGIATLSNIGRLLDNEGVSRTAEAWDKRMQMLDRLRHFSQDELRPLVLPGEEDEAASYLITAAEQVPAALLSCCGGAGFSALTLGAVGDSVAAARARSPLTDQELQLYAGLLAGSIQAGIYMNLNRVGGRLLEQSISGLGRASGRGLAGYTLAGLNAMSGMTTEAAKLLMAGKLAGAADLGAQELASRLSRTASNIDWQAFGDNLTDIEANMHEAAGLLPFLLLGSGRLGLQHFRSTRAILGEGRLLERLGVPEQQVELIMRETEPEQQSELLRESLTHCRIFSGGGEYRNAQRALGLLQTDEFRDFFKGDQVRDFLRLPPEEPKLTTAEGQGDAAAEPLNIGGRQVEALQIWNEWRELSPLGESAPDYRILPDDSRTRGIALFQEGQYWQNTQPLTYLTLPELNEQMQQCTEDLVRHSYLFLMNVYSLDTMQDFKRDMKLWKASADMARRKLLGEVVKAVAGVCDGRTFASSLTRLNRFMSEFSSAKKRDRYHLVPQTRRRRNFLDRILKRGNSTTAYYWSKHYPEAQEALDIVRTMHRGVFMLANLAPQMPDFQTALTRGLEPGRAVTHYLCRVLGLLRSDTDVRAQVHTRNITPMKEYTARSAEQFEFYRRLTGQELEEALSADGHTYVRGRRVDGTLTHWHETAEQVINDIAGNAALEYTDLGKPVYTLDKLTDEDGTFNLMEVTPPPGKASYTKADQGCSLALSELGSLWHGTATSMQPGLSIRRDKRLLAQLGDEMTLYSPLAAKGETFRAAHVYTNTPIAMAQTRFETAIRRQIMSGYVDPLELMSRLTERGYVPAEKLEELRSRVGSEYDFSRAGRVYEPRRAEDRAAARALEEVVQSATQYAVNYFLGMQGALQYPQRLSAWLATQAFQPGESGPGSRKLTPELKDKELTKWANRTAADFLREHLPGIELARAAEQQAADRGQDILSELLEDMVSLRGVRNYEQGWCHYSGGESGACAVYSAPQTHWNMLREPLRTWKGLGRSRQAHQLRKYLEKFCSQVSYFTDQSAEAPVDYAIGQLDALLHKYPEMHRYSASRVDEGRLYRMELKDEDFSARYADAARTPLPLYKRDKVRRGYELHRVEELPEFMTREEGGRACMLLLDHLRSYGVHRPMADASGIWWRNKLYGQFGKAPAGLEEAYVPIHPLLPLLDKLREAGARADSSSPLSICGTEIRGVNPALKVGPISQATTYRLPGDASRVYRLMPGDPMLDGTPLRVPYVVQSERGAYIGRRGIVQDEDGMRHACIPLQLFNPSESRISSDQQGEHWARRGYKDAIDRLMSLSWAPGESMAHRSAYVLEYMLRLGEDSGFSQMMAHRQLSECSPEEAALLNLMGDLITAVCADDPAPAMARLEQAAERYRKGEDEMLPRIVDYLSSLRHNPAAFAAPRALRRPAARVEIPLLPQSSEQAAEQNEP